MAGAARTVRDSAPLAGFPTKVDPVAEWRHVAERFLGFISSLRPLSDEHQKAHESVALVIANLRTHFRGADFLPVFRPSAENTEAAEDHMLVGSLGKGTAIRHDRVVDVIYTPSPEIRARIGSGQALTRELVSALAEQFAGVDWADQGWISVTPGTPFTVRLLPASPCRDGGFLIENQAKPTSRDLGAWRYINPGVEAARLAKADQQSGNKATHLILMLKAWRRTHALPIGAFALELLVTEFVSVWNYYRRSLLFYDWMMRDFFFWLRYQGERRLAIPGTLNSLYLDSSWQAAAECAYRGAKRASVLERDNREGEALAEWRRIFGPAVGGAPALAAPSIPAVAAS
jgi:hypothetical protein